MGLLNILTGGKSKKAIKAAQAAIDAFKAVGIPDIAAQRLALEQLVSQGELSPEEAQTIFQQDSELSQYSTDPRLRQAQMAALDQLTRIGSEGGLTDTDRAAILEAQNQMGAQERGSREAILQNMAARGLGGSGTELMAQLANQQGQATRGALAGTQIAADARQRALDAILGGGQLGGQIQGQDFAQAQAKAQAQDVINRFNAANMQNQINMNVMNRNQAAAQNLANRQNIANQNTALRNQQQMYNKGLIQQRFQNQMQRAGGIAGAQQNLANLYNQQGGQVLGLIGGALGAGGTALGGYLSRPAAAASTGFAPGTMPFTELDPEGVFK